MDTQTLKILETLGFTPLNMLLIYGLIQLWRKLNEALKHNEECNDDRAAIRAQLEELNARMLMCPSKTCPQRNAPPRSTGL